MADAPSTSDTPIYDETLQALRAQCAAVRITHPCVGCGKRNMVKPGSRGLEGALCLVCIYDL